MEVVVGGMESNEDSSVGGSKGKDDCSGEVGSLVGEGHGVAVTDDNGDWKGDGLSSGRNRGSFIPRVLIAEGWSE